MTWRAASIQQARLAMFDAGKGKKPSFGSQLGDIEFGINPKELSWTRTASWDSKAQKKPQVPEYTGVTPGTMSFEAFLAEPTTPDVGAAIDAFFRCVEVQAGSKNENPRPPFVQLQWGEYRSEAMVVKSVTVKVSMFSPSGSPMRATVQLQLQEVPLHKGFTNPTSGGAPGRRIHVVVAGDTLQSIAHQELDDPNRWRDIAALNRVDDPMRLRLGQRLLIPVTADLQPTAS